MINGFWDIYIRELECWTGGMEWSTGLERLELNVEWWSAEMEWIDTCITILYSYMSYSHDSVIRQHDDRHKIMDKFGKGGRAKLLKNFPHPFSQ